MSLLTITGTETAIFFVLGFYGVLLDSILWQSFRPCYYQAFESHNSELEQYASVFALYIRPSLAEVIESEEGFI